MVSKVLSDAIGIPGDTVDGRVEAMRVATRLADLAQEVRQEAALLPEHVEPDVMLEDFSQFDTLFDHLTLARQVRVGDMMAKVDAAAHRSLDMLSRQLHRYRPQPTVDEKVRQDLLMNVRHLRQQVAQDGALAKDVQDFILSRFGEIERVLREARITGALPIEMATDGLIGSIRRHPRMWQRVAESVFSEAVAGIVAGLFLTLVNPPSPEALPPGTPQPVINNYVQIYDHPPEGGVTPDIIEGMIVPDGQTPGDLPAPP